MLFFPCFNLSFARARLLCSFTPTSASVWPWVGEGEAALRLLCICLAGCRCCQSPPHLSHHLLCVVTLSAWRRISLTAWKEAGCAGGCLCSHSHCWPCIPCPPSQQELSQEQRRGTVELHLHLPEGTWSVWVIFMTA